MQQQRYDFLDIAKGIVILWVVWMHMEMPMYIWPCFQMPFFFFISGTLYKQPTIEKTGVWLKNKAFTLLVPAITFMFIVFVVKFLQRESLFIEGTIVDKLQIVYSGSIIWFLQAMFIFICVHYVIVRWIKRKLAGILITMLIYPIGYYIYANKLDQIPCFALSSILIFWMYFELGCLLGKNYTLIIDSNKKYQRIVSAIIATIFVITVCTPEINELCFRRLFGGKNILVPIYMPIFNLCVIYLVILFSHNIEKIKFSVLWKFYGVNSIVVYLTHLLVYVNIVKPWIENGLNRFLGYVMVVLMSTICIYFFNNCCPIFIGKKKNKLINKS